MGNRGMVDHPGRAGEEVWRTSSKGLSLSATCSRGMLSGRLLTMLRGISLAGLNSSRSSRPLLRSPAPPDPLTSGYPPPTGTHKDQIISVHLGPPWHTSVLGRARPP